MPLKMSLKVCYTLAASVAMILLAVSLAAPAAVAASRHRHHAVAVHRVHRAYAARRWHHFARRYPPAYGYAAVPPRAIAGPGYVFVPGAGILGEDCDMPTSTCTNEYRDVQ